MKIKLLLFALILCLPGCKTPNAVVAHTGTLLGLDISENPSTGLYHAKLGYGRSELAIVPTGYSTNNPQGAKEVASVIMEVKMQNLFKGGGVYQRLAVGDAAVSQPGALFMFAKDADGTLSSNAVDAITRSLQSLPAADAAANAAKVPLAEAYNSSTNKTSFDAVATTAGYDSFASFLKNAKLTWADVKVMIEALKNANIIKK